MNNDIYTMPEQELTPPEGDSKVTQDDINNEVTKILINNEVTKILINEDVQGKLTFIDHDAYLYDFAADVLAILKSTETDRADKLLDIECLRDRYQELYLSGLVDTDYYQNKARSNLGVF